MTRAPRLVTPDAARPTAAQHSMAAQRGVAQKDGAQQALAQQAAAPPVAAPASTIPGWDDLPLRPELRGEVPYGAPQLDVAVRLNVNENPHPPGPALVADIGRAVAEAAGSLNRYPDRDALALREELAAYVAGDVARDRGDSGDALSAGDRAREDRTSAGRRTLASTTLHLGSENIWAANGSNEIMLQLLQAFGGPGRVALGFAPTYSMYPEYCRDTFTDYTTLPRNADFSIDVDAAVTHVTRHQPDVIFLASPNNPTGTAVDLATIDALCRASHGIVVVDEAYAEFRRAGQRSAIELLAAHPHLVVTRTMSKAFALAGARLGYLVASPAIVAAVQIVRLPYHLSSVTQAVARTALAHSESLLAGVADLREQRDSLVTWLRDQPGIVAADSDANFVLFGRFTDRDATWQRLLDEGVLIRVTGPDGWLRVSAGTAAEMAAFRGALVASRRPADVIDATTWRRETNLEKES